MLVYLNPGHDIRLDSGAVNRELNLRECDLARRAGTASARLLREAGHDVLVGQADNLSRICTEANEAGADIFISIHFNAFNTHVGGTEVYVSGSAASARLGASIYENLQKNLHFAPRGLKDGSRLFVLRQTVMPSVLAEICFIDNTAEIRRYLETEAEAAAALVAGVENYLRSGG